MIVVQSYSELSQTTAREISQRFYSLTISTKATSQMLNYAKETPLIIYDTSLIKFFKNLSYLQLYNFSLCGL